jgi:hypothetical protein
MGIKEKGKKREQKGAKGSVQAISTLGKVAYHR